jgi:hypothetical protein
MNLRWFPCHNADIPTSVNLNSLALEEKAYSTSNSVVEGTPALSRLKNYEVNSNKKGTSGL